MNFPAKVVFNNINHGYRAAIYIEEKFFVGALSYMVVATIAIIKRSAEQCTLQLHCTSLRKKVN